MIVVPLKIALQLVTKEPYRSLVLYEKSHIRGQGLSVSSESPFHINISNAFVETLDQAIETLSSSIKTWSQANSFIPKNDIKESKIKNDERSAKNSNKIQPIPSNCVLIENQPVASTNQMLKIYHNRSLPLDLEERVAFSLLNLTGERIRVHKHATSEVSKWEKTSLKYLAHMERLKLNFQATILVPLNLSLAEVPFDQSFRASSIRQRNQGSITSEKQLDLSVDIQVPGFEWVSKIGLDTIGERFVSIIPMQQTIKAKIDNDWRLRNVLQLLTETYSYNGGRQISFRSAFEIINKTSHSIDISIHPDPTFRPEGTAQKHNSESVDSNEVNENQFHSNAKEYFCIEPEGAFNIPVLLLESALRMKGIHLGSIWLRPSDYVISPNSVENVMHQKSTSGTAKPYQKTGYSSRPIQLAKLVHETSKMFDKKLRNPSSFAIGGIGIQITCPIIHGTGVESASPFCYAVEIERSPLFKKQDSTINADSIHEESETSEIIRANHGSDLNSNMSSESKILGLNNSLGVTKAKMNFVEADRKRSRNVNHHEIHAPITYSLIIHPPIVIENLLCEEGTFELMHAFRRTIVWRAVLAAGEKVPIHTVGLDAPLYLLINLGYCRTPYGKGALVHDGNKRSKQGM